jgi:homoserine O-succinyltransferase/O-acetyltransferase
MKTNLRVAVLDMYNGAPNEGMRCISQILHEFREHDAPGAVFDFFNVRQLAQVPDLSYDIYISSGGPGSPLETTDEWEERYFVWFNSLLRYNETAEFKKYVFLICHSFQMIARYLQIGTVKKRNSTSFGVFPMHRLEDGLDEPFFEGLPDRFYAVDSRDYQLINPNLNKINQLGIKLLCIEKDRPHRPEYPRAIMAVRFTDEIFGTQFHPEADALGMLHYFSKDEKREAVIENYGIDKLNDMIEHLNDPDKILLTESVIIPSFLRHAAENLVDALAQ